MVFILSKTTNEISITPFKDFMKVIVSTLSMIFIIKILGDTDLFGIILIASVGYLATFLLIKGMDEEDIRILKNLLLKDS